MPNYTITIKVKVSANNKRQARKNLFGKKSKIYILEIKEDEEIYKPLTDRD